MRYSSWLAAVVTVLLLVGCRQQQGEAADEESTHPDGDSAVQTRVTRALSRAVSRSEALSDSIREALKPVPLLRSSEEQALRRYLNQQQLSAARRLGVSPPQDSAAAAALQRQGDLVRLEDSTAYWVIRKLDHSIPMVTPDVKALLSEIGERFQAELEAMGLPALRVEVTSVLRTAANQAALRRVNPNAAGGTSTHEFGTTLDVAYSGFAAPQDLPDGMAPDDDVAWLTPYVHYLGARAVEAAASGKSRELQAILGRVLQEIQSEGKVMVTMERRQPVYHMTVAQRY